jgi:hypothetical protein
MLNDKYMCLDPCSGSYGDGGAGWPYCSYWNCVSWATWQIVGHSALLHKGTPKPDYTLGNCNSVNFTKLKPSEWEQGHTVSIKVNGNWYDPGPYCTSS